MLNLLCLLFSLISMLNQRVFFKFKIDSELVDGFNEESIVENHFVVGVSFESECLHESIKENSSFNQSKMLTNTVSRSSIEGNEGEGSHTLFIEPSFRHEGMGIFEVFGVSVNCNRYGLNESSLSNGDVLEHVILKGNTVEELASRSVETLGFLDGTVKVGEFKKDILRVISVAIKFVLKFLLDISILSEVPDGHTTEMSSGVHTSNVESHEFTDDFFEGEITKEVVLLQIVDKIFLGRLFTTTF